jgi:hypothetical protein
LSRLLHSFIRGKISPKNWLPSVIFKEMHKRKQSPTRRKFGQSGHHAQDDKGEQKDLLAVLEKFEKLSHIKENYRKLFRLYVNIIFNFFLKFVSLSLTMQVTVTDISVKIKKKIFLKKIGHMPF